MNRSIPSLLTPLLILFGALAMPAFADEDEDPKELLNAAGRAYHAARKCVTRGRKNPKKQFIENEKAIGHLEQAARLLEKFLEYEPDDHGGTRMIMDVNALLMWCRKNSPLVHPEEDDEAEEEEKRRKAEEEAAELERRAKEDADEEAREKAQEARRRAEALRRRVETEAKRLLAAAKDYRDKNPKDKMGALAKFFLVAQRFGHTPAGKEAKAIAEKLQTALFKVKPIIKKKKKPKKLKKKQKDKISKMLRSWLKNRQKVRCNSCQGKGSSTCKRCKGTGKLHGRAGRVATCGKCKWGKVYCSRSSCSGGVNTRFLEKVVIKARAPYYQEKLKALLGGSKKAVNNFLKALAAHLSGSARAPATIVNCASELGIAPVQLRDVIQNHGPSKGILTPFKNFKLGKIRRKVRYTLRGKSAGGQRETVSVEELDGKWYVRAIQ